MLYVIIGLSILFVLVAFSVTEKNAKHILSGYNTMTKEDQAKFDLPSYISKFKNFHLFLGISMLVIGLALHYFISENAGGIFVGTYPIIAYIYFIWSTGKNADGSIERNNKFSVFILVAVLIFVLGLFGMGFKEDHLNILSDKIELEGSYGETILEEEIESIELVEKIPAIRFKVNGFALGKIKKGYFKTKDGERIKLILNARNNPYILISKKDKKKIYYSTKEADNKAVFNQLKSTFKGIDFK